MANRIINTEVWDDLLEISIETRLYYLYLYTTCNHAGLIKPQRAIVGIHCGNIDIGKVEAELTEYGLIVPLANGKLFLPQFIRVNYRDLDTNNSNAAKSCLRLLKENGINIETLHEGFIKGSSTLQDNSIHYIDKDIIVKEKETIKEITKDEICWPENFSDEHKQLWLDYEQTRESIPKPPYSPAARQLALNEFVYSASTDPKKYTQGLEASIRGAWVSPKWFAPAVGKYEQPSGQKISISAPTPKVRP